MSGSTFGKIFRATTFGESHGTALGVVIDGVPAGTKIDEKKIQDLLDRRRPGAKTNGKANAAVTSRSEADKAEILSGVFEGKAEGTPIAIEIRNTSQHSSDYSNLKDAYRPGHADYSYFEKYGFRDYRGGGRASGRETCARVAAGAVALQFLEQTLGKKFSVTAYTLRAAGISCKKIDLKAIEQNPLRAADLNAARAMQEKIEALRAAGDSAGGVVECQINGVPAGLGEPVFEKLDATLAAAMLSIGAVKGIEFGAGFEAADMTGSENNDQIYAKGSKAAFRSNNAGGLLGGMSNGDTIIFRVAVKPVPSIFAEQKTVKRKGDKFEETDLKIQGRHDVCLCPRIVPVVEAMAALAIADAVLQNRAARI
ncbi:MAG: chorismate synthase [Treponema sp.]|nr:chorismate synthase [Treponema sp.]